jgi:hypothetical protein
VSLEHAIDGAIIVLRMTARAPHCQDPLERTAPIRGSLREFLTRVHEVRYIRSVRRFVTIFSGVLSVWRRRSASFVERHRGAFTTFVRNPRDNEGISLY